MLRRDAGKSVSICDGFRKRYFLHLGRGFLPLLAVMLLATPQLAFAQDTLAVTVNPRSLDIDEGDDGEYTVVLDTQPAAGVTVTVRVVGATDVVTVDDDELDFDSNTWDTAQTITVSAREDMNAVDETVTLTHTATVGEDAVTLRNVSVVVRVDDNDPRSVTLSGTSVDVAEAGSAEYMVTLGTEPTATVTVDIGGASGEITVSPSRLFFTPDNYTTQQTVTVFAGEDFDAEHDTATLTHTVRGGDYTGVSVSPAPGTVSVTVGDNDVRGVAVSATGTLTIAAGASATYTIMLDSQPTRTVSISVAQDPNNENADVRVSTSRLSFSTSNWNRPQTVTVRTDSDAMGSATVQHAVETTSSSRDKSYDRATVANANVSVTIEDSQPGIRLSPSSVNIDEGAARTYTVRLATSPEANQTVTVAVVSSNSDVTTVPDSLDFTEDDWNTGQPVTVSAAEDDDAVSDTAMLTHRNSTATGAILANGMLRVTIRENDTRGVTVTPMSLEVTEGATGTYSVVLDSQPVGDDDGNVTVTISGASGDVTVDPSQLTFTDADWFRAQEVEVSAADDPDGEPDDAVTLSHTVRGGDYDRQRVDNVRVTIRENETRGITATPASLTIGEGDAGEYMVRLEAQPTGTVTVMVRGASGDVTVNPARLIFTTSNWNEPKTVEVKAGQDADSEPDAAVTLTHAASGGGYNGVTGGMVTVTITEDEIPGVTVTPRALTVTEGSAAGTYTVVLNTEPTGTVTITLGGLDDAKGQSLMVTPTTLTFTQRNWNIAQMVSVSAAEDSDGTGTENTPVMLTHSVNGGGYSGVTALPVSVTVRDNDTAGLTVTPTRLEITQGSSRTYTVVLNTKPTGDVTVTVTGEPTGVTASPSPLTFTSENWSTPRTVRVHVASTATATATNEEPPRLRNEVSSTGLNGDSVYDALPDVEVQLTIKDSSVAGVAVNPTSLSITEGGSESYTVVLTKAPTATVYVEVSGAADDVRVSRSRLTFSTSNWNREQTVTVSVSEDDDAVQDAAVTLTHKVTGAEEYEEADPPLTISSVTVTLSENDTRGVTVAPTSLTIAAGVSGTYRVRLNTEPTDAVTIVVNSPTDDVTVTGSPLVFTTANWSAEQTVTVSVDEDAGSDEPQSVTLTHSVTGGDYLGVEPASVTVTIPVEGAPSAPTGLTAESGDQSATLTWGAPADDGGTAILRYEFRYRETGGSYGSWGTVPGGASARSATVTGPGQRDLL